MRFSNKSDWIKIFDPRDFTIFVRTDSPPNIGDVVRIDLTIEVPGEEGPGPRVILRGTVTSRRERAEGSLPSGCSVALGANEREKVNYLNGYVRGGLLNLRERRRLPLRLPVTYGGLNGPCHTFTRDINEQGIFVITRDPLPEATKVHLLVTVPTRPKPLSLNGTVTHTVVVEDEDIPGMGIVFAEEHCTQALSDIIDELEQQFLSGRLPDDVLL